MIERRKTRVGHAVVLDLCSRVEVLKRHEIEYASDAYGLMSHDGWGLTAIQEKVLMKIHSDLFGENVSCCRLRDWSSLGMVIERL